MIKTLLHILKVQFTHPPPKPRYRFAGRIGPIYRWEPINDKRAPAIFCRADLFWENAATPTRQYIPSTVRKPR